jgi:hypothetical protein
MSLNDDEDDGVLTYMARFGPMVISWHGCSSTAAGVVFLQLTIL